MTREDETSFSPLFQFLDEFNRYNTTGESDRRQRHRHLTPVFQPKFDVKELPQSYELHGELPGVEQKDVEIEFVDPQTLVIKGRTERSYTAGTPPAGLVEGAPAKNTITESGEKPAAHKATVEDEEAAKATEVVKQTPAKPAEPKAKYWVSERSVGEFSRTFSFPGSIDQDAVSASMKNGILSIVIPKMQKTGTRKIAIA